MMIAWEKVRNKLQRGVMSVNHCCYYPGELMSSLTEQNNDIQDRPNKL